jgi:hypothetical protein
MRHRSIALAVVLGAAVAIPAAPHVTSAAVPAAQPSDFNGDGDADLAIGTPKAFAFEGSVNVLYGGPGGLTASGDDLWSQRAPGVRGTPSSNDQFGTAVASGDFDRDGFADLAIGVPGEDVDGVPRGAISVLYGSPTGLTADRDQLLTTADVPVSLDMSFLGASLAAADVNGDGYWDIAAGAPSSDDLDGVAVVLFGGPGGITTSGAALLDRSMTGAPDDPNAPYQFGSTIAAGDLDGDGFAEVAVGISGGGDTGGEVAVFNGGAAGIDPAGVLWSQATKGIENGGDVLGGFGSALAIADFNGDGRGDLAAGAPEENVPGCVDPCYGSGGVNVLYGSDAGLTTDGDQLWRQSSPGVPGSEEYFDTFGHALAAADFDGDGFADLAIGVPGEDAKRNPGLGQGSVVVLYGSASGLSAAGVQRWTQDSAGFPGAAEDGDWLGRSLVAGDYGRSGRDDLVIGVPRETHHGVNHAGLVTVLYGTTSGLTTTRAQVWSPATTGVRGSAATRYFAEVLGR